VMLDTQTKDKNFAEPICYYAESVFNIVTPTPYADYKLTFSTNGILFLSQAHFYV